MLSLVNYQDKMLDAYNKNVEALPTEFTFFRDDTHTVHKGFLTYRTLNIEFDDVVLTTDTPIHRGDVIEIDGLRLICISHVLLKRYGVYYEATFRHCAYSIGVSMSGVYLEDRVPRTFLDLLGTNDTDIGYIYGFTGSNNSTTTSFILSTRYGEIYNMINDTSEDTVARFKQLSQSDPEHYYFNASLTGEIQYSLIYLMLTFTPLNPNDKFPGLTAYPFTSASSDNITRAVPDFTKEGLLVCKLTE